LRIVRGDYRQRIVSYNRTTLLNRFPQV
jgi:hypothetical protein